ncbi:fluoride efflux transporter CrcB [Pararhodonellum marinum]|uniref:fluoride efflux transporter CrcB n=1 Tax=Pararhodonellum marinum TaxID=2755358 RepID=UPI001890123D|nr:fluoride efflux transporter CrcB [Pararhodonellum marinum]
MKSALLLVGLGGMIGSVLRYLSFYFLTKWIPSSFPWGTFTANVLGCLLIGLVFGLSDRVSWITPEWRLFLATGICGGYTTFSTFSMENLRFLQTGQYGLFIGYSLGSFLLGLLAVLSGLWLGK